jgi:hypothetical protein
MVAERQARYPKGTYKVLFARRDGNMEYSVVNLYTGRQSKPRSIWEFIKGIENDLSANKFPQSSIQYRSWGSQGEPRPERNKVVEIESAKTAALPEDCNPTFIIQVLYRQNATWQGTIQWLEGRQTRLYRSVNELLKLMDEAVELTEAGQRDGPPEGSA